jgi:putative transposase
MLPGPCQLAYQTDLMVRQAHGSMRGEWKVVTTSRQVAGTSPSRNSCSGNIPEGTHVATTSHSISQRHLSCDESGESPAGHCARRPGSRSVLGAPGQRGAAFGWDLFAASLMTNHFHLFFRTPEPNLSRGMQWLLGGYATWWNNRHHRMGHVFQGRFKAQLVEDDRYFWTVSRYVHRNPVPWLAAHPGHYRWSTYGGYVGRQPRLDWVDYEALLAAWQGDFGGDPQAGYQRFVEADLDQSVPSPFAEAEDGWILGSPSFVEHVRGLISPASQEPQACRARQRFAWTLEQVATAVCEYYGVTTAELARRGSRHVARPAFASLARRHTAAKLRELAGWLGVSRRDCVPNLLRRAVGDERIEADLALIEQRLASVSAVTA